MTDRCHCDSSMPVSKARVHLADRRIQLTNLLKRDSKPLSLNDRTVSHDNVHARTQGAYTQLNRKKSLSLTVTQEQFTHRQKLCIKAVHKYR